MRLLFFLLLFVSCTSHQENELIDQNNDRPNIQAIDKNDIKVEGKTYELSNSVEFGKVSDFLKLSNHEKVALVSFKDEVRVYPYYFTNHFEVINALFDSKHIAITYCPLTKSGICFNRFIDNETYKILAFGYLYKDNMFTSDKEQNFYWSQMLMKIISTNKTGKVIENFNLIETNWKTVKDYIPEAKIYYNYKRQAEATDPIYSPTQNSQHIYGILNNKIEIEVNLFKYDIFK